MYSFIVVLSTFHGEAKSGEVGAQKCEKMLHTPQSTLESLSLVSHVLIQLDSHATVRGTRVCITSCILVAQAVTIRHPHVHTYILIVFFNNSILH